MSWNRAVKDDGRWVVVQFNTIFAHTMTVSGFHDNFQSNECDDIIVLIHPRFKVGSFQGS